MIAAGSPSADDQAALIADRVECLYDLSQPVLTEEAIPLQDIMHFFKGDTPAKQYERGTQMGGYYKCGSCGCHSECMDDLTIALQCSWRSFSDLQSLALNGKYGNTPNGIKPFESLNKLQLQQELRSRNIYHGAKTKKDLMAILFKTLKGVQRVPTLLLGNPTEELGNLHLQQYTVLDSEPLQDIKGHFIHLFNNLPAILSGEIKELCEQIIASNQRKEKLTCAELRLTAIQVYLALANKYPANSDVVSLLETAVSISEICTCHLHSVALNAFCSYTTVHGCIICYAESFSHSLRVLCLAATCIILLCMLQCSMKS